MKRIIMNNFLPTANNTKNGVTRKERIVHMQEENKNYKELAIISLGRHETGKKNKLYIFIQPYKKAV